MENPSSSFSRLWWSSAVAWIKRHWKRVIVSFGGIVASTALGLWQERALVAAWNWFWAFAWPHRIGVLSLVLLLAVFVLMVVLILGSYVDARRQMHRRTATPLPLSLEERQSIEAARVVWRKYGAQACFELVECLDRMARDLKPLKYWAPLLEKEVSTFKAAGNEVDIALTNDSALPLKDVIQRLEDLVVAYQRATNWVRQIGQQDVPLTNEPYASATRQWREHNRVFLDKLAELGHRSDFPGAKFVPANGDVRKFMGLHEIAGLP